MQTFNIQLKGLTFPVVTNDDRLDQETLKLGLDCILPPKMFIPTGIELILVDCLNTPQGTQWTLHFSITNPAWPNEDPSFTENFASDIKDYILEIEGGMPIVYKTIDTVYRTLTIIYHAG